MIDSKVDGAWHSIFVPLWSIDLKIVLWYIFSHSNLFSFELWLVESGDTSTESKIKIKIFSSWNFSQIFTESDSWLRTHFFCDIHIGFIWCSLLCDYILNVWFTWRNIKLICSCMHGNLFAVYCVDQWISVKNMNYWPNNLEWEMEKDLTTFSWCSSAFFQLTQLRKCCYRFAFSLYWYRFFLMRQSLLPEML